MTNNGVKFRVSHDRRSLVEHTSEDRSNYGGRGRLNSSGGQGFPWIYLRSYLQFSTLYFVFYNLFYNIAQ